MMKILVTGANGFIGKNLIQHLVKRNDIEILHYDIGTSDDLLKKNLKECDFIFHFAAVHRPKEIGEFYSVNNGFLDYIITELKANGNHCPFLLTSSIQALDNNDYGRSKYIAETHLRKYAKETNAKVIIYRLYNTFGKWATPNLHSVVATFCYNIARDLPITISNRDIEMKFYYIDDVINSFLKNLEKVEQPCQDGIYRLPENKIYKITLGELANTILYFRQCEKDNIEIAINEDITDKLYTTYKSYK